MDTATVIERLELEGLSPKLLPNNVWWKNRIQITEGAQRNIVCQPNDGYMARLAGHWCCSCKQWTKSAKCKHTDLLT